jgi:hypothetical protein
MTLNLHEAIDGIGLIMLTSLIFETLAFRNDPGAPYRNFICRDHNIATKDKRLKSSRTVAFRLPGGSDSYRNTFSAVAG